MEEFLRLERITFVNFCEDVGQAVMREQRERMNHK